MHRSLGHRIAIVAVALVISAGIVAADAARTAPRPPLDPRNAPLAFSLGRWICHGQYETVPPFTVAHAVIATFHVTPEVAGEWITGDYDEFASSNGFVLSLDDSFAIDPFVPGAGLRTFVDSTSGQFQGGFAIEGDRFEFSGTYVLAHTPVPFTETLVKLSDRVFTTEARVVLGGAPTVFHRQRCVKVSDRASD